MSKQKFLRTANEIRNEIFELGHFVIRHVNGIYEGEYDLKNPCGLDWPENNGLFPEEGEFQQAIKLDKSILIVTVGGDIIEITKSNQDYYDINNAIKLIDKFSDNTSINIYQTITRNGKEFINNFDANKDEAKLLINELYVNSKTRFLSFYSEDNHIKLGSRVNIENGLQYGVSIFIPTFFKKIRIGSNIKLIQTNKFKEHMNVHTKEFIVPYENLLMYLKNKGHFDNLSTPFVQMLIEVPFNIGYSGMCSIGTADEIVYAKRKNRDIYSKFSLSGKRKMVSKCVIILKQSKERRNEYYLITMFAGEYLIKEIQDKNIESDLEMKKIREFWDEHAFVFNPNDIDMSTVTKVCPYSVLV